MNAHYGSISAIHEREQQLREITDQLLAVGDDSVDTHLPEIWGFITKRLGDLQKLKPAEARKEPLEPHGALVCVGCHNANTRRTNAVLQENALHLFKSRLRNHLAVKPQA
jgi:hypothetical protein